MKPRFSYAEVAPGIIDAMMSLQKRVNGSGLETHLLDLVVLRASQINHCAYCIDMHTKDLRAEGETEQRLYMLDAWRESSLYSDRERAALAWTEAVTVLTDDFVPDDVYEEARSQFDERELSFLTLAIITINGWNRLNVAFRAPSGDYVSPRKAKASAN